MNKQASKTHDYLTTYWGHNIPHWKASDDGKTASVMGFSSEPIEVGDYLKMRNKTGEAHYRVTKIKFLFDPTDMFEAELEFKPRTVCKKCHAWAYDMEEFKKTHKCN